MQVSNHAGGLIGIAGLGHGEVYRQAGSAMNGNQFRCFWVGCCLSKDWCGPKL